MSYTGEGVQEISLNLGEGVYSKVDTHGDFLFQRKLRIHSSRIAKVGSKGGPGENQFYFESFSKNQNKYVLIEFSNYDWLSLIPYF